MYTFSRFGKLYLHLYEQCLVTLGKKIVAIKKEFSNCMVPFFKAETDGCYYQLMRRTVGLGYAKHTLHSFKI